MTDTPKPQLDLSDEGLREIAAQMYGRVITYKDEYLIALLRSVRDQARAEERKRTLLWAADHVDFDWGTAADMLRRAAEGGGKGA